MTVMKAVRIHDYGGPEVMRIEDVPVPVAGPGEILVRVHAASVNPVDWKVRDGMLRTGLPLDLPVTLGGDFSGVVVAGGDGVTDLPAGTAVFGMTRSPGYAFGGLAEYVAVRAVNVAIKPASLGHVEAGSVPLAALTAWQALFDRGGVAAGQRVLIHAAAGGVGSFAVQFAHAAGATVIATASAANAHYLRDLGAAQVIDYRETRFETVLQGIDVVIDLVGGDTQARSYGVLRPGGTLVNAWGAIMQDKADAASARGIKVAVRPDRDQLTEIGRRLAVGELRTRIAATFPPDRAAEAFELSKAAHVRGKLVIVMTPDPA
jgi:NADPH:quinone reductase-like Zn-dependent oxidoreductase